MSGCLVLQGCDEFGDHFSGSSKEDHEQHTDYESPGVASSRHGHPGVTDVMAHGGLGNRAIYSSARAGTRVIIEGQKIPVSESSGCPD